jgi:hypothetical protein
MATQDIWVQASAVLRAWHVGGELGLGLPQVWARAGKGGRIHVAILDSGVARTRGLPDDRIMQLQPSGAPAERRDRTSTFHGTQVVSVLASADPEAIGIAPEVRCSCFNVYDVRQRPVESRVIAAFDRALAMRVDLICCAFTLDRLSEQLRARIEAARAALIPIVASATNTGESSPFPDRADGVICVAASTALATIMARPTGCSAKIAAPGFAILASTPVGVRQFSGTSAAAPVAAGLIVLALAHARTRGVEPWFRRNLRELLVSTANPRTQPPSIDARALLRAIEDQQP